MVTAVGVSGLHDAYISYGLVRQVSRFTSPCSVGAYVTRGVLYLFDSYTHSVWYSYSILLDLKAKESCVERHVTVALRASAVFIGSVST